MKGKNVVLIAAGCVAAAGIVFALGRSGGSSPGGSLPPGADRASYERLCIQAGDSLSCEYAKDKQWVYFNNEIVPGADAATFTVVDQYYAKDKNHVYYSAHGVAMPQIVPGDPATFKNLGGDALYTLDQTTVFWDNTPIPNADPSTFVELFAQGAPTVYGKDSTTVYHDGSVVAGADPNSFRVIAIDSTTPNGGGDGYAEDDSHVYHDGSTVPGADPKTFVPPDATEMPPASSQAPSSESSGTDESPNEPPPDASSTTIPLEPVATSTSEDNPPPQNNGYTNGVFTGFTLSNSPSGSTNAYYPPQGIEKDANGF